MQRVPIVCTLQVENSSTGGLEKSWPSLLNHSSSPSAGNPGWENTARVVVTKAGDNVISHVPSSGWIGEVCALAEKGSKEMDGFSMMRDINGRGRKVSKAVLCPLYP